MSGAPPRMLEWIVGLFIPPSRREDVLGDLRERYSNLWQYLLEAVSTTPMVILSRRSAYHRPAALPDGGASSLRIVPERPLVREQGDARTTSGDCFVRRSPPPSRSPILLLYDVWVAAGKALALPRLAPARRDRIGGARACARSLLSRAKSAVFGAGIAALLVSTVRMLFLPGAGLPQRTVGPDQPAKDIGRRRRYQKMPGACGTPAWPLCFSRFSSWPSAMAGCRS